MKWIERHISYVALGIILAISPFLLGSTSSAQQFPAKTVRIVVPYAPGGPTDVIARILAAPLQEQLGQTVIVENRAGANTNIGTAFVARSEADGHTLLITSTTFTINPSLYKNVPYDPIKDFEPVQDLATSPNAFVASTASGIRSLKDLIDRESAKPGALNYGTAGIGTPTHLAAELLNIRAKTKLVHVPYAGGGPAAQALLGGQIELGSLALPNVQSAIKAGTMVPLAVTGQQRWPGLPDVATMIELGYPDFVSETAMLFLAPKGTPLEALKRLSQETAEILKRPDVIARINALGFTVLGGGPETLRARIAREVPEFNRIIEGANLPRM